MYSGSFTLFTYYFKRASQHLQAFVHYCQAPSFFGGIFDFRVSDIKTFAIILYKKKDGIVLSLDDYLHMGGLGVFGDVG